MAQPKVGGLRTMGSRDEVEAGVEPDLSVPAQLNRKYKHVFQSRKSHFVISLKRRRLHWMPDGSREEEVPTSEAGNRLDMVRFTDHFFRTDDDEIAAAFEDLAKTKPELVGIEGLCWRYEDKVAEQRAARVAELRRELEQDAELRAAVALAPSDKKDWDAPKKDAPRAQRKVEEMTPEELEAATIPAPGSRTR